MRRFNRIFLLFLLALLLGSCASKEKPACNDFLAYLSNKPHFIEYLGYEHEVDRQGAPLRANYRVAGVNAAAAERYMQSTFGMKDLQRHCCVWDSTPHFFRDEASGIGYIMQMGTQETKIRAREFWGGVDFFFISVSAYSEDP